MRIAKDIKIIEVDRDEDDRILIVKTLTEITAVAIFEGWSYLPELLTKNSTFRFFLYCTARQHPEAYPASTFETL